MLMTLRLLHNWFNGHFPPLLGKNEANGHCRLSRHSTSSIKAQVARYMNSKYVVMQVDSSNLHTNESCNV